MASPIQTDDWDSVLPYTLWFDGDWRGILVWKKSLKVCILNSFQSTRVRWYWEDVMCRDGLTGSLDLWAWTFNQTGLQYI